jgi:transcriptional regulator with GAF, ATPase, and Fis domain
MNDMEFFHQATLRICGSLDVETILRRCMQYLKAFIPLDGLMMTTIEDEKDCIRVLGKESSINLKDADALIPLTPEAKSYVEHHRSRVSIIGSPDTHPMAHIFWQAQGLTSVSSLSLVLEIDERRLGVLVSFVEGIDRYTTEHARLIQLLHDPFAIAMANALQHREIVRLKELLVDDNRFLHRQLFQASGAEIVGERYGLRVVMEQVRQVAPLSTPILLLGETGVGKEVIANAVHHSSERRDDPLVKVNCGAIPESLLDSELFGHEKGAFTGALAMKRGRFERADKGTLFLDEIGELPAAAQVRLLRVLQTGEIERVGGTRPIHVDVRIIAATHRDMEAMVRTGEFREDLWFRLNVFPILIPPLRQRKSDIPALVNFIIERKAQEMNLASHPVLAPGAVERLKKYDWPGNVRELENAVERALIRSQAGQFDEPLYFEDFSKFKPATEPHPTDSVESLVTLEEVMRRHICMALDLTGGKVQGDNGAAALLGINPSTLRNRMRKLKIPFGRCHRR